MDTKNKINHTWSEKEPTTFTENETRKDDYAISFQSRDAIIPDYPRRKSFKNNKKCEPTAAVNIHVEHPTTYCESLMHVLKGNIGSGIFAMGDAYKNAGVAVAPWLIVLLGLICVHCQHLLLNASKKVKEKLNLEKSPDFAETAELCFAAGPVRIQKYATFVRKLVNVFLCITQFGFCCVYFVFISKNMQQVADQNGFYLDVRYHMSIIFLPILLSCMVRNLKYLAPISIIANILLLVGIVIILYYATQGLQPLSSAKAFASIQQLPLCFGTALFAFEGIGLVLPIQAEMKKPKLFDSSLGVLNVGMTFVALLFVTVGFLSYLKYGEDIMGSVTLNLEKSEILAQCVKLIISLAIMLSFALQFYIPIEIMWPSVCKRYGPFKHPVRLELLFRILFVCVTFVLAEIIPYLELFISLVGALSSTTLALIIPPLLEFITHWTVSEVTPWMIFKNTFILILGVLGCLTGSYESIRKIIIELVSRNT